MGDQEQLFRPQLQKILDSKEFAAAPQVRQFLAYVSEAAFQNRERLEQVEIADHVLGKHGTFNPVDDASVRRIATLTRQKIQKYYAESGRADPVTVTLPVRSYIPVFQMREAQAEHETARQDVIERAPADHPPASRWPKWAVAGLILVAVGSAAGYAIHRSNRSVAARSFEIITRRGSVENKALELAGSGIFLGPRIGEFEDVSVRFHFSPEQVYQQAGLLIYESPDQYVKLGRQFSGRTYWEFGVENGGVYPRPPGTWTYDPLGQNGLAACLMIRRRGGSFSAFVSSDGIEWRRVGQPLEMADSMPNARIGIYGNNGQVDAATAHARFEDLAAGLTFVGSTEHIPVGWDASSDCAEPPVYGVVENALEFRFAPRPCIWNLSRRAPSGNWSMTTRLDLLPFSGTVAGLSIRGNKGRLRLVRWALKGGSIAVEFPPGNQVSTAPDFPGCPPVVLKLEVRDGVVKGSFSRDQVNWVTLDAAMRLDALGGDIQAGITTQLTSWSQAEVLPAPRFYYVRQQVPEVTRLQ